MSRKPILLAVLFLGLLSLCAQAAERVVNTATRVVHDFNPGWRLLVGDPAGASEPGFDDKDWKQITLPRAWNEDEAFKNDIADLSTGIAWYRKTFTLPAGVEKRKVFIEFEGVRQAADVYVNGKPAGFHENGITAFGLDISGLVKSGENVIAVRTDNSWTYAERATKQKYQWEDKNFNANYGGIPKNVRLHGMERLYQTLPLYSKLDTVGVYVHATDFDLKARAATLTAESEVRNETGEERRFTYEVQIVDMQGVTVATFSSGPHVLKPGSTTVVKAAQRVAGLNFWSWGYGYLYEVRTALKADGKAFDVVSTRTGFRQTTFEKGVITLNGRVMQVHGYAQRTSNEWPAIGLSVPPWLSDFSNGLMVKSGGNLVRWMHITPWKQDVESCDRVGLPEAMPAGDSEADVKGRRWEQRVEVMRDAIIYNRNNPSILFYEVGNKGVSEEHMAEMKALRDRYDPHGGRAIGSREMLNKDTAAEYGGEMLYINKSARIPFWAMEYSRDEGLRKYWDEFSPPYHKNGDGPQHKGASAAAYNHNQDSHAIENVVRWYDYWRERPGTGVRVSSGGVNIVWSDTNTHHRGAENYRRSGEVDAMRLPKDGYFAHEVMWDCWVDIERPRIHILGHWNYQAGLSKPVTVVSSAEKVELFLNGKSLGLGEQSSRFLFTFANVSWLAGKLEARGYDKNGALVCETSVQTAGAPVALRLSCQTGPLGLRADGADLALVEFEVVDAEGHRCPTALNEVSFKLEGPGEWRGGIAQGPDNYILSKILPVECGVNRALLRSTTEAGKIVLTAQAEGLKGATLEISTRAVAMKEGFGLQPASAELKPSLARGPTPAGSSYVATRRAVQVLSTKAGSGTEKPEASIDDDELTKWTSEAGKPAWISYELAHEAKINEVCLKLSGWRQRSYPIIITIDGQKVFEGETPKSLGYVTLPVKAVAGRQVRIELVGESKDKDEYNLTEVANQKNTDTGANRLPSGVLSIIEVEFYEGL